MTPAPDRRLTPHSGRVALSLLRGQVVAPAYTDGEPGRIIAPLADLRATPGGARDRQLLWGDGVQVIDRRDGHAFVQADKDGYCGWIAEAAIGAVVTPTHRVATPASHVYPEPRVQTEARHWLPMGARLAVLGHSGAFSETPEGYVPTAHLAALDAPAADPVAVAETLLGAPYLWGGNSAQGVDCSGLVQLALHTAGRICPGDSDMQRGLGVALYANAPLQRGDLVFWRGHVAMMLDGGRIIHANGHTMSVAVEDLASATARIAAAGGGDITARRRP